MILLFSVLLHFALSQDSSEVCEDSTWKCLTWKHYCNDPQNRYYMEINCRQTCGLCPICEDLDTTCAIQKSKCQDGAKKAWMEKNCQKSCGFCKVQATTTTPAPSPTPTWRVIPAGKCGVPKVQNGRVINGVNAAKGAWPWQILIRFMDEPHCGGTIISPFWVLTAAHCVADKEVLISRFEVIVGEHDFDNDTEGTEMAIGVSKFVIHNQYQRNVLDYDVALMKLSRPVPFGKYVATACLPDKGYEIPTGTKCFITGWGKINPFDSMHHKLQQAMLPVVDRKACHSFNKNFTLLDVNERMICGGHGPSNPTGGCHGDSGGPFVCQAKNGQWYLQGSVSWGSARCNTKEAYTVFAKTSYFREWIDLQTA
ncbi:chymotrypsinogen B [Hydra vulgaris]|uniref:Chymotrypsinogen B n=1 Tax=Hydra vulgaris TaxID=6087 RepID=A0ABM4BDH7_HYDVU